MDWATFNEFTSRLLTMTDSRATWLVQAGECVGVELGGQTAVLYLLILLFPKHVCGEVPGHSLLHELVFCCVEAGTVFFARCTAIYTWVSSLHCLAQMLALCSPIH